MDAAGTEPFLSAVRPFNSTGKAPKSKTNPQIIISMSKTDRKQFVFFYIDVLRSVIDTQTSR